MSSNGSREAEAGDNPDPPAGRFEFRIFGQTVVPFVARLESLMAESERSESGGVYLLAPEMDDVNLKIRNGQLDVKRRIAVVDQFEQWCPEPVGTFPLSAADNGASIGLLDTGAIDAADFVGKFLSAAPTHRVMHVLKARRHFARNDLMGEACEVVVNGASIHSVAIEGEDLESLRTLRTAIGLDNAPNVSYVRALQQIAGLQPLPADSRFRAAAYG
jgi:hypothetical protein